jgi:hypothetical protein
MKKSLSEKHLVVVLFVVVLVIFSFADRDSKKLDKLYTTAGVIRPVTDHTVALADRLAVSVDNPKN